MITETAIASVLARKHVARPSGTSVELEIHKQPGKVSRHRQYLVYLPAGYTPTQQYPLVMVLHGCLQDHMAIRAITNFDAIADRVGAIVVYPFVTTYSGLRTQNCWGWWINGQRKRGAGEVSDLRSIAEEVSARYSVDSKRRHICGLSAGGAMTVASLVAYSDYWTSGASVAGVPYGESSRSVSVNPHVPVRHKSVSTLTRMLSRELVAQPPSLLIIQSTADKVVSPRLADNLRDSWVCVSGSDPRPSMVFSNTTRAIAWQLEQFNVQGALRVGQFLVDDLAHGWPGGLPGKFCIPDAPNCSELIWYFFEYCAAR